MFVRSTDGTVEQVGTWKAEPGRELHVTMAASAAPEDIETVVVRTADGTPVLRLDAVRSVCEARWRAHLNHRRDPNDVNSRSRIASIGQTGASGSGCSPRCQSQSAIARITAGSCAITVTGTSWPGSSPLTNECGWWSPATISTRSGSG